MYFSTTVYVGISSCQPFERIDQLTVTQLNHLLILRSRMAGRVSTYGPACPEIVEQGEKNNLTLS